MWLRLLIACKSPNSNVTSRIKDAKLKFFAVTKTRTRALTLKRNKYIVTGFAIFWSAKVLFKIEDLRRNKKQKV